MNHNNGQGTLHFGGWDYLRVNDSAVPSRRSEPSPVQSLARRAMATMRGNEGAAARLMTECGVPHLDALHACLKSERPEPGEQIEPLQRGVDNAIATLLRDPAHTAYTVVREVAQATGLTFSEASIRVARVGALRYDVLDEMAGAPPPAANARGYRQLR